MGGSSFNKKFNAFIKTLFDNNYIFYLYQSGKKIATMSVIKGVIK